MAVHQLCSQTQVPALSRQDFSWQSMSPQFPYLLLKSKQSSRGGTNPLVVALVMVPISRSHVLQAGAQPGRQDIQPVSCWVTICWPAGMMWLQPRAGHGLAVP